MFFLPWPLTSIRLKSFWMAISPFLAAVVSYPLSRLLPLHWFPLFLLVTLLVAVPGYVKPSIASKAYRIHNRLAHLLSRYTQGFFLFICFCIVSIAGGNKIPFLQNHSIRNKDSLWVYRDKHCSTNPSTAKPSSVKKIKPKGFSVSFAEWTLMSGNWWMILLLPFLFVISVFDQEEQAYDIPSNIYTLY